MDNQEEIGHIVLGSEESPKVQTQDDYKVYMGMSE
jgi:hypothetical protein